MQIIWRALITYVDNKLRAGQSVNMKKFGAFTFDILPRTSSETDLLGSAVGKRLPIREAGKLRSEGKDYVMQDGDVVNFLFNV